MAKVYRLTFKQELTSLLKRYGKDEEIGLQDHELADFLIYSLKALGQVIKKSQTCTPIVNEPLNFGAIGNKNDSYGTFPVVSSEIKFDASKSYEKIGD